MIKVVCQRQSELVGLREHPELRSSRRGDTVRPAFTGYLGGPVLTEQLSLHLPSRGKQFTENLCLGFSFCCVVNCMFTLLHLSIFLSEVYLHQ